MTMDIHVKVYKTETGARKKFNELKEFSEEYPLHSRFPTIKYRKDYERWVVTWTVIYEKRPRRRRK